MKKILFVWFLLTIELEVTPYFDPAKFDYCPLRCGNEEHTACKCEERGAKNDIIMDDNDGFRLYMVELHNEFRDLIARGDEPNCPKASNMMAVDYDLELEYISKCHAKIMGQEHDKCRKLHDSTINAGQNLYFSSGKPESGEYNKTYKSELALWYDEIKSFTGNKEEKLKKFSSGGNVGHFTQMVWATVTHVGCIRAWSPSGGGYILVCDYAADKGGGNILGYPVYNFGEPCSECPKGSKCSKEGKFKALCINESGKKDTSGKMDSSEKQNASEKQPVLKDRRIVGRRKLGENESYTLFSIPDVYTQQYSRMNKSSTTRKSFFNFADELIAETAPRLQENNLIPFFISLIVAYLN